MSKNHNVFISWSGERSRSVAGFLRGWISAVVQAAKPWMSESEIDKGSRSLGEISKALADIKVGIVCLTPENLDRPWLLFEGGALSKSIDERTRLCTYLIGGIEASDVTPPLGMFQATKATKQDTLKLVRTINQVVSDDPLNDESLEEVFEAMWPKLEAHLSSLPSSPDVIPAKRTPDEIMAEILELARAQANYREKTQFIDAYMPMFQQFLPLLQQVVMRANLADAGAAQALPKPAGRRALQIPLPARRCEAVSVNTFQFPKTLQNEMPTNPAHSGSIINLVEMIGQAGKRGADSYVHLRFVAEGRMLENGTRERYDLGFMFDTQDAHALATSVHELATFAEHI